MPTIRSVITDPDAKDPVHIAERELREPGPDEVVVRVSAFSLNRGELRSAPAKPPGSPIGWDVAGTIERSVADGPPEGTRVVGFSRRQEGWAEQVCLPAVDVAALPDSISDTVAATLPVAAGTALACCEAGQRSWLGRRVLVTGVTGGVGGFAVQLLRLAGATVVAQVRREEQVGAAEALGADEVLVSSDGAGVAEAGPFDGVIDGVGGDLFRAGVTALRPDGFAVNYGVTGASTVELPLGSLLGKGRATVRGLNLYAVSSVEAPRGWLARLLELVGKNRLEVSAAEVRPWTEVGELSRRFLERGFAGKAVCTL